MVDEDGNRYYSDKEKCNLIEKGWKDIFRITEEDETNFDSDHSNHIDTYINIPQQRITPCQEVDLTRLTNDNMYLKRIDRSEIKRYLNKSKKKATGASNNKKANN